MPIKFLFLAILYSGLLFITSPHVVPVTPDSINYISTAASLKQGTGLLTVNFAVDPVLANYVPLQLFPPGYPLLIYWLSLCGIEAARAAVLIPRIFFLLLPAAFYFVLRRIIGRLGALITAVLSTSMFALIKTALIAWSDVPHLLFCLGSLAFLAEAVDRRKLSLAVAAGLCAGFAVLIRHAGYALVGSVLTGLCIAFMFRLLPVRLFLKLILGFLASAALVYLPYVVRNLDVFGRLQPYSRPPSRITLSENLSDYGRTLAEMFLGNECFLPVLFIVVAVLGIFFISGRRRVPNRPADDAPGSVMGLIFFCYFVMGSALVIASSTLYQGAERVNNRYLIQYAWIVVAAAVYCLGCLLRRSGWNGQEKALAVLLLMLVFVFSQIFPAARFLLNEKGKLAVFRQMEKRKGYFQDIPRDVLVVSNEAEYFCLLTGRPARMLSRFTPFGLHELVGKSRPFAVVLMLGDMEPYLSWNFVWRGPIPPDYRLHSADNTMVILLHPGG